MTRERRDAIPAMRRAMTPAESRLWQALRHNRLAGLHFRRQHELGASIADFCCERARLVVEVDGPIYDVPSQVEHDRDRDAGLAEAGYLTLRFGNEAVLHELRQVLESIRDVAIARMDRDAVTAAMPRRSAR